MYHFDTGKNTSMRHMFWNDGELESLNLKHLDTSSVNYMDGTFGGNISLERINDLSDFNTHNVTNVSQMFEYDFDFDRPKVLDLRKFYTNKVTDMSSMFRANLEKLILDNLFGPRTLLKWLECLLIYIQLGQLVLVLGMILI